MDLTKLHLHWRISQYNGKQYRSYSLARCYRVDGKNRKEIIVKLGKLSDSEAMKWRITLQAIKKPDSFLTTLDDLIVIDRYDYLDVAVTSAIWDQYELDNIFKNNGKRNVDISVIARILTINRCIDPAAKSQTPDWFHNTALPWLLDVNPETVNSARIFRELTVIENRKEEICNHLFTKINQKNPGSMKTVFYDLSSTTFTGSRCILMQWGHCKEGYHNHVVLALVVNKDGLPFYWEVLQGGTADSKTINWLLDRLKARFKIMKITVVFDRGMVSDENLTLIESEQIKYISAMDKNQLEGITGVNFSKYSYLKPGEVDKQAAELSNFTKLNDNTYYREIKIEEKRRYILCFNPQLFKDQRKARIQAISNFHAFVKDMNTELSSAKKSRQRKSTYNKFNKKLVKTKLDNFVDIRLEKINVKIKDDTSIRTYQAQVIVNDIAMSTAGKLDGFWLLVTNHTEKDQKNIFIVSAPDAILPYKNKVIIESDFRDIKSFIDIAPVYVWTASHVKAHYTICVLAHLINRTLKISLHKNPGKKTQEVVSHEKLYKKLSGCKIDHIKAENVNLSTYRLTTKQGHQIELLKRIGLTNLLDDNIAKKANSTI